MQNYNSKILLYSIKAYLLTDQSTIKDVIATSKPLKRQIILCWNISYTVGFHSGFIDFALKYNWF